MCSKAGGLPKYDLMAKMRGGGGLNTPQRRWSHLSNLNCLHVVKNVSLLDRIFSVSASTLWQLSFISYFSIFLLLSFPFAKRLPFCAMIYLENISKCAQGTAHNEKTIVCLHYGSFLSNIPWVQRWSVTRLLARVLAGSPHLVLAPIDGLVATPGSSSLTGRVFWLRCFFFFLLQFVKTLSSPFHGSPSLARAKLSNIVWSDKCW